MTMALALWALAAGVVGVVGAQSPTITAPSPIQSLGSTITASSTIQAGTGKEDSAVKLPRYPLYTYTYTTTYPITTITFRDTTSTSAQSNPATVTKTEVSVSKSTDIETKTTTVYVPTTVYVTKSQTITETDFETTTLTDLTTTTETVFATTTQTDLTTTTTTKTDFKTTTETITDLETSTDFRTATQIITDSETLTDLRTATQTLPPVIITSDVVITTAITKPPVTVTTTVSNSRTTVTLPASTVFLTSTVQVTNTVSGLTTTQPGKTITISKITTCGTPTNTAPVVPQATDANAIFGCAPGYVCNPPKPDDCNFWSGAPDYSYQCDPQYCIPSPPLPPHVIWPTNETTYFPPVPGYFNLDPQAFGLSYDIFVQDEVIDTVIGKDGNEVLTTYTTGNWASQTSITHFPLPTASSRKRDKIQKRDTTIAASVCFNTCNACYIEGSSFGRTPELCTDPAFLGDYERCIGCIDAHSDTTKTSLTTYVQPAFAPYVDYCAIRLGDTPPFHLINSTTAGTSSTTTSSALSITLVTTASSITSSTTSSTKSSSTFSSTSSSTFSSTSSITPSTTLSNTPFSSFEATSPAASFIGTSLSTRTSAPSNTVFTNSTSLPLPPQYTGYATSLRPAIFLTSILLISLLLLVL